MDETGPRAHVPTCPRVVSGEFSRPPSSILIRPFLMRTGKGGDGNRLAEGTLLASNVIRQSLRMTGSLRSYGVKIKGCMAGCISAARGDERFFCIKPERCRRNNTCTPLISRSSYSSFVGVGGFQTCYLQPYTQSLGNQRYPDSIKISSTPCQILRSSQFHSDFISERSLFSESVQSKLPSSHRHDYSVARTFINPCIAKATLLQPQRLGKQHHEHHQHHDLPPTTVIGPGTTDGPYSPMLVVALSSNAPAEFPWHYAPSSLRTGIPSLVGRRRHRAPTTTNDLPTGWDDMHGVPANPGPLRS